MREQERLAKEHKLSGPIEGLNNHFPIKLSILILSYVDPMILICEDCCDEFDGEEGDELCEDCIERDERWFECDPVYD